MSAIDDEAFNVNARTALAAAIHAALSVAPHCAENFRVIVAPAEIFVFVRSYRMWIEYELPLSL
jgi:hypothetical protein